MYISNLILTKEDLKIYKFLPVENKSITLRLPKYDYKYFNISGESYVNNQRSTN